MGREVRRVPADWQHPKDASGHYIPLYGRSAGMAIANWEEGQQKWNEGLRKDWGDMTWVPIGNDVVSETYEEWSGERPDPSDYMPDWPESERTHFQMYEDVSEGTPISPVMATEEELARWLAGNNANACAGMTATYEQWLATIKAGSAPSMYFDGHRLMSGVEAMGQHDKART